MKYAFFPGCVSRGGCPELYPAAVKVCGKLGIELEELKGASCTGAGVLQEKNLELGDTLNARTFAMAEKMGLPIMTICSTCQGVMMRANYSLKHKPEYLAKINRILAEEGLEYKGTTVVKHLLWVLLEDYGLDRFKSLVTRPLSNLKLAPFYGCYIIRPSWELEFRAHPDRERSLHIIVEAVGAQVVDFEGAYKCCGFPILTINERNSVRMVANHTGAAKDKGADAMVTPCPLCHLNLDGYQPKAESVAGRKIGLPILHLPQVLGLAMGFDPKEMGLQKHIVSAKELGAQIAG